MSEQIFKFLGKLQVKILFLDFLVQSFFKKKKNPTEVKPKEKRPLVTHLSLSV